MAGFGRSPFGRGPFGRSDLGKDLLINLFPEQYFDDSIILDTGETLTDNDKDPLLILLKGFSHSVNKRRVDVDDLETLIDYESAPLEIVRLMGDMLGLGIDKNDPEFLQRSFLGNASQWLQIKATKRGYQIRGLASGFDVSVDNFWRIDPAYSPFIPLYHQFILKPKDADSGAVGILHVDVPPGTYAGTPTVEDSTYAKSSYVRVVFSVAEPRLPLVDYNKLLDLIIDKIRDVMGIHHELQAIQFLTRIPVSTDITFSFEFNEFCHVINANEFYRYDIVPADEMACDNDAGTVTITTGDGVYFGCGTTVTGTFDGGLHESIRLDFYMTSIGVRVDESSDFQVTASLSAILTRTEEYVWGADCSLSSDYLIEETDNFDLSVSISAEIEAEQGRGLEVDVTESAEILIESEVGIDQSVTVSSEQIPGESSQFGVSVSNSASIQKIDMSASIDLSVTVSIDVSGTDGISMTLSVSVSVDPEIDELATIESDEFLAVDWSRIDAVAEIDVNETVTLTVGLIDEIGIPVSVTKTTSFLLQEAGSLEASESASGLLEQIDSYAEIEITETESVSLIPGVIFVYSIDVNEFAFIQVEEFSGFSISDVIVASVGEIISESEISLDVSPDSQWVIESYAGIDLSVSESISLIPGEGVPIIINNPISVVFYRIDGIAEIPVGETVTIEVDVFDGVIMEADVTSVVEIGSEEISGLSLTDSISCASTNSEDCGISLTESLSVSIELVQVIDLVVPVTASVGVLVEELGEIPADETLSVVFYRIDGIAEIPVGETVTIEVDVFDGVIMEADVTSVVEIGSEEISGLSLTDSISCASTNSEDCGISLTESLSVSIELVQVIDLVVPVTSSVGVLVDELGEIPADETLSVVFYRIDGIAEIPVGETATITISAFDSINIPVPVSGTAEIGTEELNNFVATESGTTSFVSHESSSPMVTVSESVSISLGDYIVIPITISESTSGLIDEEFSYAISSAPNVQYGIVEDEEIEINIYETITVELIVAVSYGVSFSISTGFESLEYSEISKDVSEQIDWAVQDSETVSISVSAGISVSMESAVSYGAAVSETLSFALFETTNPQANVSGTASDYSEENSRPQVSVSGSSNISGFEISGFSIDSGAFSSESIFSEALVEITDTITSDIACHEFGEIGIDETLSVILSIGFEIVLVADVDSSVDIQVAEISEIDSTQYLNAFGYSDEGFEAQIVETENLTVKIDLATAYGITVSGSSDLISDEHCGVSVLASGSVSINTDESGSFEIDESENVSVSIILATQYGVSVTATSSFLSDEQSSVEVTESVSANIGAEEDFGTGISESMSVSIQVGFVTEYGVTVPGAATINAEELTGVDAIETTSASVQISEVSEIGITETATATGSVEQVTEYGVTVSPTVQGSGTESISASLTQSISFSGHIESVAGVGVDESVSESVTISELLGSSVSSVVSRTDLIDEQWSHAVLESIGSGFIIHSLANFSITSSGSVSGTASGTEAVSGISISIDSYPSVSSIFAEYGSVGLIASGTATPGVEEVLEGEIWVQNLYDLTEADIITTDLHETISWQITIGP